MVVALKPDVIVETGVNRGGSALFFAPMCRLLGKGRGGSIDIQIAAAGRQAVEQSPFSDLITLIEGDSASAEVVNQKAKKGSEPLIYQHTLTLSVC